MNPNLKMRWPQGRRKALTFSFDDGIYQDSGLIKLFRKYDMYATFNVNSGLFGKQTELVREGVAVNGSRIAADQIAEIYQGFEVAVHTVTHRHMSALSDAEAAKEIMDDRKSIEDLVGYPVRGMAWPCGSVWANRRVKRIAEMCGIVYARGTDHETGRYELPRDPMDWDCSCHQWHLEPLIDPFLKGENEEAWLLSAWGHSYEFDVRSDWDRFERQLSSLSGCENIWYATNIDIFDYYNTWHTMRCSADGNTLKNMSCITLFGSFNGE